MATAWYQLTTQAAVEQLGSDATRGLEQADVRRRVEQHGPNALRDLGGRGAWHILWEQLSSSMVLLLLVAAAVSVILGETTDTVVILAIVVLNAALGFFQDYRAERALAALKRLSAPVVRVRRDGKICELSARELVPGDIVQLEVGNYVPADCRILESVNLKLEEAALTGESTTVDKHTEPLHDDELALGDRHNMAFMGTVVTFGHGQGLVTATGMQTELGKIAESLQSVKAEATPLQKRLAQLGRWLAVAALGIVILVFVVGVLRGEDPRLMLLTALSMAVAIVPEGLPAVATVSLALGARRMFAKRALIRKLPAVETLGSVSVICSDKTGTLTENRMTLTLLDVAGERLNIAQGDDEEGAAGAAERSPPQTSLEQHVADNSALALLLAGAGLCNDATLQNEAAEEGYVAVGEPTEAALAVAAANLGLQPDDLQQHFPRVDELPFDSERKRMTTLHTIPSGPLPPGPLQRVGEVMAQNFPQATHLAVCKGAVDSLLEICDRAWDGERAVPLGEQLREKLAIANDELAAAGMRVLGVAFGAREWPQQQDSTLERDLIFVGFLGLQDPPRAEVGAAMARCRQAGIRPLMITGDHPLTAQHIARTLRLSDNEQVLTGRQVDRMDEHQLTTALQSTSVYARVAPQHKLRLVRALQKQGHVVAMTGDGVNDAPALKQAHIGVAMGITGTDVSKEASQMVLLDDNFATIVNAVEQGRIVYDNIRKFVRYTLTSNSGEVWVMVLGPLLGMPLPLLPLQILWINLVTDGLPGLALAFENAERNTMRRPPFPQQQHILSGGLGRDIVWIGFLMGLCSLAMGYWDWKTGHSQSSHWRTMIFTTLTLSQMGYVMALRSQRDSLFTIGVFSNPLLVLSVGVTFALQMAVIYLPALQGIFHTTALTAAELGGCIVLSGAVFWIVEGQKFLARRLRRDSRRVPQGN